MPLEITAKAMKDLQAMPAKDSDALLSKLEAFARTGAGDVKRLQGSPLLRLRHGDWRALLETRNGIVVLRVLARKDAYR